MQPSCDFVDRIFVHISEAFQKVLEMEPNFMSARSMLGHAYEQNGMYEKAIAEYEEVLKTLGENAEVKASINALRARTYAAWGKPAEAAQLVQDLEQDHPATSYLMAHAYAALGEKEKAFAALDQAFDERHIQLVGLKTDPALDSLRDDQRFQVLMRRVGLPQ